MPGLNENPKPEISGAITYPSQEERSGTRENIQQPRQPTNLQGLLRFAMEANATGEGSSNSNSTADSNSTNAATDPNSSSNSNSSNPNSSNPNSSNPNSSSTANSEAHNLPMDEQRKKFLEDALKSMTVDVVAILQKQIQILQTAEDVKADTDISTYEEAFDTILDYIDNIDVANDFHKIGGFTIFHPCLKCEHPKIRANACNVLAELCQNNLYCQRVVLDNSFMPILLKILDTDESDEVCVKALYAVSCVIRENTEGFNQFIMYGGLSVLLKTLQKTEDKLRTKSTFLLAALCRSHTDLKSRLVFLDYVPVLLRLIKEARMPNHEHILSLLVLLVEENQTAMVECRKPDHNFKEALLNHLELVRNKEECMEEEQYCRRLLRMLFTTISSLGSRPM